MIKKQDAYVFSLDVNDGLPYLRIRPFIDTEREECSHVFVASDPDYDPTVYDNSISD